MVAILSLLNGSAKPGPRCHSGKPTVSDHQIAYTIIRSSGKRHVADLRPGDDEQQWSPLKRLKTRLYHPANLALNSELMTVVDEVGPLRTWISNLDRSPAYSQMSGCRRSV